MCPTLSFVCHQQVLGCQELLGNCDKWRFGLALAANGAQFLHMGISWDLTGKNMCLFLPQKSLSTICHAISIHEKFAMVIIYQIKKYKRIFIKCLTWAMVCCKKFNSVRQFFWQCASPPPLPSYLFYLAICIRCPQRFAKDFTTVHG